MPVASASFLGLGPHGFHRIAYTEWKTPTSGRTLVCAHGLTRHGRDFDALAAALQGSHRVVCPDLPGRGASDWLPAAGDYSYPVYLADMAALLARLGVEDGDWLGTSMGGLIGLMLAAQPRTPIRRLVLNDVGPFISATALKRIADYVGSNPGFASLADLEAHLRAIHAPFGPLTDAQWRQLAGNSGRQLPDGRWALHYDPKIGDVIRAAPPADVVLWNFWDAVRCPVLVLRGQESDVLTAETARLMQSRGPKDVTVHEFPGVGHAPALLADDQVGVVQEWLAATG